MDQKKEIADRLKNLRTKKGLTQKDLAKKLDVSNTLICKVETGEVNASDFLLKAYRNYFGVSLSFLRTGKEPTGLDEDSLDELCGLLKYCDKKLEQTEEDIEETRTIIKKIFELMNP